MDYSQYGKKYFPCPRTAEIEDKLKIKFVVFGKTRNKAYSEFVMKHFSAHLIKLG